MMWILKSDKASGFSCETDEDLFRHITETENAKLLEDHAEFGQTSWSFGFYTPQRLATLCNHLQQAFVTPLMREACEKDMGYIEIYKGDIDNPIEVIVTPFINVKALKKQWCLDYCKAHNFSVTEQAVARDSSQMPVPSDLATPFTTNSPLSSEFDQQPVMHPEKMVFGSWGEK